MKSAAGDSVLLQLPGGTEYLTVLEVCYEPFLWNRFREPAGAEASAKDFLADANHLTKVSEAAHENSRPQARSQTCLFLC